MSVGMLFEAVVQRITLANFSDVQGMSRALLSADNRLKCLGVADCSSSAM